MTEWHNADLAKIKSKTSEELMNELKANASLGGLKYDACKPDFSLISPVALTYLAQVLTFGAKKYDAHNWRKGIPESKIIAASYRHLVAMAAGITTDAETGLPHAAHLMCECMFILEQQAITRGGGDLFMYNTAQKNLLETLLANVVSNEVTTSNDKQSNQS
jgi:hypothetical protein